MMSEQDSRPSQGDASNPAEMPLAVAADIDIAAASDVPVLISADPQQSRAIALQLDRAGRCRRGAVQVVDCRQPDALASHPLPVHRSGPSVLLLQEVHALSREDQVRLDQQLEAVLAAPPTDRVRVVASSSTSLFDQVRQRRFQERLYYRLNMIHIVVPRSTPGGHHPTGS